MSSISRMEAEGYESLRSREQKDKFRVIIPWIDIKKRVLDVGCGTGLLLRYLPNKAVGVDPSEEMLNVARAKNPQNHFVQASANALPFSDHEFDIVTCISAAHLFDDKEKSFSELIRVGKDAFIIAYPHSSASSDELASIIRKKFVIIKSVKSRIDKIFLLKCKGHRHQT